MNLIRRLLKKISSHEKGTKVNITNSKEPESERSLDAAKEELLMIERKWQEYWGA